MSFLVNPQQFDAFERLRVASTGQRLDVEFIYDKQPDFFDEDTDSGTVTHNANSRDLTLSLSDAVDGSYALMSSHPVPYTPGNSQLATLTGVLDLAALGGGTAQYFVRSNVTGSVVETVVDQGDWARLSSGVDWTKAHIFTIDFQSLKVGTIRFGLSQGGRTVQVGQVDNDNVRDTGFWQLPTLPMCWRLYNDATYTYMELGYGDTSNAVGFRYRVAVNASATMRAICCTVKSEGGLALQDMQGLERAVTAGTGGTTVGNSLIPIMSIRTRATFQSLPNLGLVIPEGVFIQTDNPIMLYLVHGATLTGASWSDVNTSASAVEFDVAASALSGGDNLHIEPIGAAKNANVLGSSVLGKTVLWDRQGSETGILTVAAIRTDTTNADVFTSLRWHEIR